MIINKLARLFDILKTRMERYDDYLRRSEYNTRILLIDPVLRKLGWDVEDPELVKMEVELARPKGLRADYVLLEHDTPVAIVEAKSFGRDLKDSRFLNQAVEYAGYAGVQLFVLTNGNLWQLYRRDQDVASRTLQPAIEFDIRYGNSTDLPKTALALRQPNLDFGQQIDSIPNSLLRNVHPSTQSSSSPPEGSPWHPISKFLTSSISKKRQPAWMKFPDGVVEPFVKPGWVGVPFNLVRWLVDTRRLSKHHLPVKRANGKALIVDSPIGKPRAVKTGFYMNRGRGSRAHFSDALDLMRQFKIDPATVFVNFGDSS